MIDERRTRARHRTLAAKPGSADNLLNVRALSYSNPAVTRRDEVEARSFRMLEFVNYGTSPAPELFN